MYTETSLLLLPIYVNLGEKSACLYSSPYKQILTILTEKKKLNIKK